MSCRVLTRNFGVVHINATSVTVEIRSVETGAILLSHSLPIGPEPAAGAPRAPLQDSVHRACPDPGLAPWVRRRSIAAAVSGVAVLLAVIVGTLLAVWQCLCVLVRGRADVDTRRAGRAPAATKRD